MVNIYHCKECHHEWESIKYEFKCPQCGADVDIMVEMPLLFYNQLLESEDDFSQCQKEQENNTDRLNYKTGCTMSATDRRKEIERLYNTDDEDICRVIEKFIKCIIVDRKDRNFLTARLNNGKIEIVDETSGKVIPWERLNDNEQWILWNDFNDLLDEIDKIRYNR